MSFKFFRGKVNDHFLINTDINQHNTQVVFRANNNVRFEHTEYCFQFDNEEPQVFASGTDNLTVVLEPTHGASLQFNNDNRVFKIFARERQ